MDQGRPETRRVSSREQTDSLERRILRRERLTRCTPDDLTIRRVRCGKGFRYLDATGATILDNGERARLSGLAIPPAWSDVRIAPRENFHLQALGEDARRRLQYRYHPRWTVVRDAIKLARLKRFGKALPAIREQVAADLRRRNVGPDLACAVAVRIIDHTHMRPGSHENMRRYGSRGATTLLADDVEIKEGDRLCLRYRSKGGKIVTESVDDRRLARIIHRLGERNGRYLFDIDSDGGSTRLTADMVNGYLRRAAGAPVSAKDFRTFFASARALELLAGQPVHGSIRGRQKMIMAVSRDVAEALHNTPAMARGSYIHPLILERWAAGKLGEDLLRGRTRRHLDRAETGLMRLLAWCA